MCTALGLLMDEALVDSVLEPLADPTLYELRNTGISERERERGDKDKNIERKKKEKKERGRER